MAEQTIRCIAVAYGDDDVDDDNNNNDGGARARVSFFVARDSGVIEKYTSVTAATRRHGGYTAGVTSAAAVVVLRGHTRAVTALCVVNADELFSCALDGSIRHWDAGVRTGNDEDEDGGGNYNNNATNRHDGRATTGGEAAASSSRTRRVVALHTPLHCLARRGDGRLCAGGGDGRLFVLDGTRQATWCAHRDVLSCVAFSRDGRATVTGSHDQQLRVWHSDTGRCVRLLRGHTGLVRAIAVVVVPSSVAAMTTMAGDGDDDDDNVDNDNNNNDGRSAAVATRWRAAHDVSDVDGARELIVSFAADATARVWALPTSMTDDDDDDNNNDVGSGDAKDSDDDDKDAATAAAVHDSSSSRNVVVSFALPEKKKATNNNNDDDDDGEATTRSRRRRSNSNSMQSGDEVVDDDDGHASTTAPAAAKTAAAAAVLPSVHEILHSGQHVKSALKKRTMQPYVRSAAALAVIELPYTPLCVQTPTAAAAGYDDNDEDDGDNDVGGGDYNNNNSGAYATARRQLQQLLCIGCVGGYVIGLHTRLLARDVLRDATTLLRHVREQAHAHTRVVHRRVRQLRKSCQQTIRAAEQRLRAAALRTRKAQRAAERRARREARQQARAAAAAAAYDDDDEENDDDDDVDAHNDDDDDEEQDEEQDDDEEDDEQQQDSDGGDDATAAARRAARLQRLLSDEQQRELQAVRRDAELQCDTQVRALHDALARDAARLAPFARHTHVYTRDAFAALAYTTVAHVHSNSNHVRQSQASHLSLGAGAEDVVALTPCNGRVYAAQADGVVPVVLAHGMAYL